MPDTDTHPINNVVAVSLDEESIAIFFEGLDEQCGQFRLRTGVKVNLRLLQQENAIFFNGQVDKDRQALADAVSHIHDVGL